MRAPELEPAPGPDRDGLPAREQIPQILADELAAPPGERAHVRLGLGATRGGDDLLELAA